MCILILDYIILHWITEAWINLVPMPDYQEPAVV